ncbi:MAG: MGT family glycosyltransferase [Acidobacteriaceae bacterium]|nr:MGT family glycosyltransferase [Acidobacteriaceae bacterium]
MARFGIFCLPLPSHLNLFLSLGEALKARGHQIVFFGIPEVEERVRMYGFEFCCLEPQTVPTGTIQALVQRMGNIAGLDALRLQLQFDRLRSEGVLGCGPEAVRHAGIDLLIIDQAEAAGGSVAEHLGLLWVSVSSGLCLNAEPRIPPFFTSWGYAETRTAILRNELAYGISRVLTRPVQNLINRFRREWQLRPVSRLDDTFSPYAQICQQIQEFDFPRRRLPECFHYVGPLGSAGMTDVAFPWDALNGKPMIYASLGTLLNQHQAIYRQIIEACTPLNVQLVLSLGGAGNVQEYAGMPGNPIVVRYAPQRELLKRAQLTITHAGLNTTLESLSEGVPMVAIPITFEQPAIAARIRWTGTGDFVAPQQLTATRLREAITRVLENPKYRTSAEKMKTVLQQTNGRERAAEIIQEVLQFATSLPRAIVWGRRG